MTDALEVRPANEADLDLARTWLAEAGLPTDDLTPGHMRNFLVAVATKGAVGVIGLEQHGDVALLRSLVVAPGCRAIGVGKKLVNALEAKAAAAGVRELWMLTIDADGYFAGLGYTLRERSEAPPAIRETPEFASLCPDDAFLMSKRC